MKCPNLAANPYKALLKEFDKEVVVKLGVLLESDEFKNWYKDDVSKIKDIPANGLIRNHVGDAFNVKDFLEYLTKRPVADLSAVFKGKIQKITRSQEESAKIIEKEGLAELNEYDSSGNKIHTYEFKDGRKDKIYSTTEWLRDFGSTIILSNGQPLVRKFDRDEYIKDQIAKGAKTQEEIVAEVNIWDQTAERGEELHRLAEHIIKDDISTLEELKKIDKFVNPFVDEDGLEGYMEKIRLFRADLLKRHPEGKILTETALFYQTDEKGIEKKVAGTADVLVIDKAGVVHIYDYKNSLKDSADQNTFKKKADQMQQKIYRTMLNGYGLEVGSMNLVGFQMNLNSDGSKITTIKSTKRMVGSIM